MNFRVDQVVFIKTGFHHGDSGVIMPASNSTGRELLVYLPTDDVYWWFNPEDLHPLSE